MKSMIIYYSFSSNTRQVSQALVEYLQAKGPVKIVELKPWNESGNFFVQACRAFWKERANIQETSFDLTDFDTVCFGTPVWAFGPAPAMNTCLDRCTGLSGKTAVLFTTYGSGTGNKRCLNYMQELLAKKGATTFKRFSIQQADVKNKDFVLAKIKTVI
jgi:flavodoxin